MIRREDWEDRLSEYLAGLDGAAFKWGTHDCALFAAGAIRAMTDVDPAASFRGKYRSQAGAFREVKRAGFESLSAIMSSIAEQIPPAFAQRGDIVADADGSLGLCMGSDALFVGEEDGAAGFVRVPMSGWATSWRIPFEE